MSELQHKARPNSPRLLFFPHQPTLRPNTTPQQKEDVSLTHLFISMLHLLEIQPVATKDIDIERY